MKKLLLSLFFFTMAAATQAQHFSWVKPDLNYRLNMNRDKNMAVRNNQIATVSGGSNVPSAPDLYRLTLLDTLGNQLWTKNIGAFSLGMPYLRAPAVTFDKTQNVVIAGNFRGTLRLDSTVLMNPGLNGTTFFVAKYNQAGTLRWLRSSTFLPDKFITSVNTETDASGNVFVTGSFYKTLTVNNTTVSGDSTNNNNDAFVAKYDPNGNLLWLKRVGQPGHDGQVKSKAAPDGSIYVVTNQPTNNINGGEKLFLVKLDQHGNELWNKTIVQAGVNNTNLALDNASNLYLTGHYRGSIDFTPTFSLTSIINYKTFLAKFSPTGQFKWAKDLATGNNYTSGVPAITFLPDNALAIAGSYIGHANFDQTAFTSYPTTNFNGFIVKTDTAGAILWTTVVPGTTTTSSNEISAIAADGASNLYIYGLGTGGTMFNDAQVNLGSNQSFLARLDGVGGNLITGTVYVDLNGNGVRDANEPGISEAFIGPNSPANSSSGANFTGPNGSYSLLLKPGLYTIAPAAKTHYTIQPVNRRLDLTGRNAVVNNVDFAMEMIPGRTDVQVTLTNQAPARPGFAFSYLLTFKNLGTTVISDFISLKYDAANLNFNSSLPAPVTQQTGQLKWEYINLMPLETRTIPVNFTVNVNAPLSTGLTATTQIGPLTGDLNPQNNFDTLGVMITGSYDPNDKQVNKPLLSPAKAANGEALEYLIRFQNTGTDTAFTVIVTDKISPKLQLNTLEMLAASHDYSLRITKSNTLEWRFNNILLPDSNRNEPASHGFIRFRIKTQPGLALTDSVANQAAIYFDYNQPVITNYAVTKVAQPRTAAAGFYLYPNPARDLVTIATDLSRHASANLKLVNILGQVIAETNLPAGKLLHYELPLTSLPKGIYLVQLQTETGTQTQRLVIQ